MTTAVDHHRAWLSRLPWLVLALVVLPVSLFAWHVRDYFVDDAFIGFQYIANLLAGQGFVFHAGSPPVEGVTNIGWLALLAPCSAICPPTLAAKLAGWTCLVCALALTMLVGKRWMIGDQSRPESIGFCLVPVLMLGSNFDFVYFSLAGMETAFLATLLLLMAWISQRRPTSLALPMLGTCAFLTHPEAAVAYPLYVLLCGVQVLEAPRRWLAVSGVYVALIGLVTVARFSYFRDVVPNTFYAKPSELGQFIEHCCAFVRGQNHNLAFPLTDWLALPVLWLGYQRLRRTGPALAAMLASVSLTGLCFGVYSPPDWTAMARHSVPYLPAVLIVFWAGIAEASGRLFGARAQTAVGRTILAAAVALLMLANIFDGKVRMAHMDAYPGYILAGKSLVSPSLWIRDQLPRQATIATRRIGVLSYYSERAVFDYAYGLPDREVARRVARHGGRFDDPSDAALADLWRARAPDYILEDGPVLNDIISAVGGTRDSFRIHGLEYQVVQRFPIGRQAEWVLAGPPRAEGAPASSRDDRLGTAPVPDS